MFWTTNKRHLTRKKKKKNEVEAKKKETLREKRNLF